MLEGYEGRKSLHIKMQDSFIIELQEYTQFYVIKQGPILPFTKSEQTEKSTFSSKDTSHF